MYRRRGAGRDAAAVSLALALAQLAARLPWRPPVTLAAVALQAYIYFASPLSPTAACLAPLRAASALAAGTRGAVDQALRRALAAPLHHADDAHLYYNMASLLVKGADLEARLGSARFAAVLVGLAVLTQAVYIALCLALRSRECGVGFSGVLFALKALACAEAPGTTRVGGVRVPTTAAAWAELVLIALVAPETSFLGHLAGIIAGTLCVYGMRMAAGRDDATLAAVLRAVFGCGAAPRAAAHAPARDAAAAAWACAHCAQRNDAATGLCAACGERRRGTWGHGSVRGGR